MELKKYGYGVGNIACEKCGGWDDVETYEDPDFGLWGECTKCKTKWTVEVDVHTETSGCPREIYVGVEICFEHTGNMEILEYPEPLTNKEKELMFDCKIEELTKEEIRIKYPKIYKKLFSDL